MASRERFLTVLPHGVLTDGTVLRTGGYVHLPNFQLWFRKKEYERLLAAVSTHPSQASGRRPSLPELGRDYRTARVRPLLRSAVA